MRQCDERGQANLSFCRPSDFGNASLALFRHGTTKLPVCLAFVLFLHAAVSVLYCSGAAPPSPREKALLREGDRVKKQPRRQRRTVIVYWQRLVVRKTSSVAHMGATLRSQGEFAQNASSVSIQSSGEKLFLKIKPTKRLKLFLKIKPTKRLKLFLKIKPPKRLKTFPPYQVNLREKNFS